MNTCDHCYSCEVLGVCCGAGRTTSQPAPLIAPADDERLTDAWHADGARNNTLMSALQRAHSCSGAMPSPAAASLALAVGESDALDITTTLKERTDVQ